MEYSFYDFLKLLGSLALFLYGMKIMSEGLQKFAGDRLRKILTAMTTNRVTGVLTGVLITALIQSSSATTVMVVSFVNAGLLTLSQSIGVIMGANIGTTVTAWIISALGFKVDIAAMALPLLAVGVPLLFSGKSNRKSIGEFIFGFSFLFMGLSLLKTNAPDLSRNPEMLSFVQNYTDMGFGSVILFVVFGTVLTMIIQASAATGGCVGARREYWYHYNRQPCRTDCQYAGQEGCAGSFGVQCFWGYLGIMPFQSCNYGGFMVCRRYNENSRSGCCRIF